VGSHSLVVAVVLTEMHAVALVAALFAHVQALNP
jgi:hypothetical protein